jgi:hypothetical protein
MKIGDVVMFNNIKSIYSKWFYGQIGIVESYSERKDVIEVHRSCRVVWLQPVRYYNSLSIYSDFSADNFEVFYEDR